MTRRALILGAGQDASYLADILLEKDYQVHLMYRRSSVDNLTRIAHCRDRLVLHQGDVCDPWSVEKVVYGEVLDEIYNEADQDSVGWSKASPDYQYDVTFRSVARLLEMVKWVAEGTRIFQPLSAHMFGDPATLETQVPQDENTRFNPQSPYAIAKVAAYHCCRYYRMLGVHVSCGILFNHDSPRRSEHYLLHKICKAAVRIAAGKQQTLALGNLDARVDVGYAKDYMEAAWLMLQQDKPDDCVIGTGMAFMVEEMVEHAFEIAGVTGIALNRVTRDKEFWHPAPASFFQADATKAFEWLGWEPKTNVWVLIEMLVKHFQEQEG